MFRSFSIYTSIILHPQFFQCLIPPIFCARAIRVGSHLRDSAADRPGGRGRAGRGLARGAPPGDAPAAPGAAAAAGSGRTDAAATRRKTWEMGIVSKKSGKIEV